MICGCPAPGAAADAARPRPCASALAARLPIPGKGRARRADFGAERQPAFGDPVRAIEPEFLGRAVRFWPPGAIGAFVHDTARTELGLPGVLGSPERACIEAVAAADARLLVMEHHADIRLIDAGGRADSDTGRIGAMHTAYGDGPLLARHAVIDRDNAPPQHAPGNLVLVLADAGAGHALDAALGVAEEFHPCHMLLLTPSRCGRW